MLKALVEGNFRAVGHISHTAALKYLGQSTVACVEDELHALLARVGSSCFSLAVEQGGDPMGVASDEQKEGKSTGPSKEEQASKAKVLFKCGLVLGYNVVLVCDVYIIQPLLRKSMKLVLVSLLRILVSCASL